MKSIVTVMDMERTDGCVWTSSGPSVISPKSSIRLNPDKSEVMKIINEIYDNDGRCNKELQCPCDTFMRHGHCGRGLFKNSLN